MSEQKIIAGDDFRKLQLLELEMLVELDRVCRANGITYQIWAGTQLGAVRHKGFIPWDDDIDIYLLREDYDRLMTLSDSFLEPYFLQNVYTDHYFSRPFARLRNSNTTGFVTQIERYEANRGIFIDLFPIDGICDEPEKDRRQKSAYRQQGHAGRGSLPAVYPDNDRIIRHGCSQLGYGLRSP